MEVYWLSFRISEEKPCSQSSYQQRYQGLMATLQDHSITIWSETTSFFIFSSDSSIETLAKAFKKIIDDRCDHFIIRKMDSKNAIICGKIADNSIFNLMNYLRKI